MAGANQIYGAGMVEAGVTMDVAQLVLDNEIARMIRHVLDGIPVSEESLLVKDIREVGWSGEFLSRASTRHGMRDMSAPKLFDRALRGNWQAAGARDIRDKARDEALRLLTEHRPEPLTADVANELDAIVERADRVAGVV